MKTNVQITAVKKEFKNGQQGYEVKVEGMDGKLDCKMNFHEPLKAMRYMFLLSKRLELQIDTVQLAALSLAYQRAKEAENKAIEDAAQAAKELGEGDEPAVLFVITERQCEIDDPLACAYHFRTIGDNPLRHQKPGSLH